MVQRLTDVSRVDFHGGGRCRGGGVANVQSQGPVPAESSALISSCIRCSNEANSVLLVTPSQSTYQY